MGEGINYSTIGGLVGLMLSEGAVNAAHYINGGTFNQPLRIYVDLLGYSVFSGLASGIAAMVEETRIANHEAEKLTLKDFAYMSANFLVPGIISICGLVKHNGEMPFIR